jgi:hypothetical protein
MTHDRYRSYVIRVRRRGSAGPGPTRLDVEDLLEGGRASVSGDPAASLADSLERLVGPDAGSGSASGNPAPATPDEGAST